MNFIKKQMYNPFAVALGFCGLLIFIFGILWILVPPPPKSIELATGFPTGLYYQFAERLKTELAKDGVGLDVRATGGTIDNLALLSDPKSGVNFAMIQGGVADVSKYPQLVSIAGMFYEPIWVWYRESTFKSDGGRLQVLGQLKGKRVAIGNEGSGTLALSTALLKASGISESDFSPEKLKPDAAIDQLKSGKIDAVFIVAAAEAPILQKFYSIPEIRLMSFDQGDAYTRNLPYLSKVSVPRGLLSSVFSMTFLSKISQ
ncbi:TAXI family TRAP transporter solute-binding subunit [Polynucleobacter necessarius]|uniref:TAXI family TRAP transporter solute-binding subunit n=1 Tax=Polynucleobacter necessarius TaxID=576610 RepID=UPI001E299BDA|nr:TAXI family TRAP transporter solute-binding subunit [Polynucleobacter necessarius]